MRTAPHENLVPSLATASIKVAPSLVPCVCCTDGPGCCKAQTLPPASAGASAPLAADGSESPIPDRMPMNEEPPLSWEEAVTISDERRKDQLVHRRRNRIERLGYTVQLEPVTVAA